MVHAVEEPYQAVRPSSGNSLSVWRVRGQTGASLKPPGRGPNPVCLLSAVSVNKDGKIPTMCCGTGTGRQTGTGTSATPREYPVMSFVSAKIDVIVRLDDSADIFRERLKKLGVVKAKGE